ncbi:MAG: hypothetical protein IJN19_06450 [Opitutales bacterium]|nr:hypothetical protein [Opitutales bacterium]
MTEEQKQDAPQVAESVVIPPATEEPVASAPESAPAEEQKQERLVDSSLEASHSEALPLSPISASAEETVPVTGKTSEKKHGRRGLRRGNSGRGQRDGKVNASRSVGIVENPGEVKETLSGKFVDGYEKDKEPRRARERREKTETPSKEESPSAQGWCLKETPEAVRRRHPQSNTNSNRAKLIIEPAPIPEQEKDPSFWQKFKAKILSIFGLNAKKKKHDKKRRGGKYRNKQGKNFQGGKNDHNVKRDFRGGNRRGRHHRGPRSGNSGARPQGGGNNSSAA